MRLNRPLPVLAALVGFVFLGSVFYISPTPESGFNTLRNLVQTTTDSHNTIIEIEGLTLGAMLTKADGVKPGENLLPWLLNTLKVRFAATLGQPDANASHPSNCTFRPERYAKTALDPEQGHFGWYRKKRRPIVSFVIILRDSEGIIPT